MTFLEGLSPMFWPVLPEVDLRIADWVDSVLSILLSLWGVKVINSKFIW